MLVMKPRYIVTLVILVIASLVVVGMVAKRSADSPELAKFAVCLKNQGAIFYGAFWCPHCANQKKLFGSAADSLPYVECSTPDGREQLAVCKDKKINGYPTWEFQDGSRETGEIPLVRLAEKTGCTLPSVSKN